jgi:ribosomal small subunit protein bTHX
MGKGDKKSKRGKIFIDSYGARRSRKVKKTEPVQNPLEEIKGTADEIKIRAPKKKNENFGYKLALVPDRLRSIQH